MATLRYRAERLSGDRGWMPHLRDGWLHYLGNVPRRPPAVGCEASHRGTAVRSVKSATTGVFGRVVTLLWLGLALLFPATVRADGILPPQPYRYLHPPPALAGSNEVPESGAANIPAALGRSKKGFLFTQDTQAGIVAPAGAFVTSPSATSVRVRIHPVDTPPGLPNNLVGEGNAYSIEAGGQPGNTPVTVGVPFTVTLRWPHIPLAIYVYYGHAWRQLCYSDVATFTTSTMSCHTRTLGTFTAVNNPVFSRTGTPKTPLSSTRFAWLNRYIPVIAAGVVLLGTAVFALMALRPGKKSRAPK